MQNDRIWFAPLTGLLFLVLLITGFALPGDVPVPADDSVETIVDFYVDNDSKVFVGGILQAIAGGVFIFFGGYLYKVLRAVGAEASAVITLAGTIVFALGVALDGTINIAIADSVDQIDPVAVQSLSALWNADFLPFAMGLLVFLMGLGVAIVRHGAFPKWMGWVAIVASLTAISPAFFVAGIIAAILIAIISVMLTRQARLPQAA